MFEIMNRYRVAILCLLFVGLFGWGAWGAIDALLSGGSEEDQEIATFQIPGEATKRSIMASEWAGVREQVGDERALSLYCMMLQLGDKSLEQFIYDYLVLKAAAEKAGVQATDGEARKFVSMFYRVDEKARVPENTLAFFRGLVSAQRFRFLYLADPGGAPYDKLWTTYKSDYELLHGRAVVFDAIKPADIPFDPDTVDKDKKALVDFWDENQWLKAANKLEAEVDLEVVHVRYADKSLAAFDAEAQKFAEALAAFPVTDEEVAKRFEIHKAAWAKLLADEAAEIARKQEAEDKQAKAENREPKDLTPGDQPSDLEKLRGRIKQEIAFGRLLAKVGEEAKSGAVLADLAKKYGLNFSEHKAMSADKLQTQPEFGTPRAKQLIFGNGAEWLASGKLKAGDIVPYESTNAQQFVAGCFDEPGAFQALFRLMAHRKEREPELKDIREKVISEIKKRRVTEDLSQRGREFKEAVTKAVDELPVMQELKTKLEGERTAALAKAMEEEKLTRDNAEHKDKIALIEARLDRERDDKLALERALHEGEALASVAAAKNLKVESIPPCYRQMASTAQWREGLSTEERKNRLFRTATVVHKLASSDIGRVGEPAYEAGGGIGAIVILDKREAPAESDLLQRPDRTKTVADRLKERPAQDEWAYRNFKSASWFSLKAPRFEEAELANEELRKRRATEDAARREVENRRKVENAFKARQAKLEQGESAPNK